ncbi:hypothetical protein TNIN_41881 [Trichonephila inaurata madagascariensis]|uniref:Uncharacterized protein n=1 Tax=Trichonephila inaurata madagascariensis TaxID=2747483 RepID=A0A8X6JK30_9ARAC|nr:hypothetical protein TNIN_41881 [Trichonephila inaurata madagascariensis]
MCEKDPHILINAITRDETRCMAVFLVWLRIVNSKCRVEHLVFPSLQESSNEQLKINIALIVIYDTARSSILSLPPWVNDWLNISVNVQSKGQLMWINGEDY